MILAAPTDFCFEAAACSYGFYLLAPNRWEAGARTLHTAVPDDEGGAWAVRIDSPHVEKVRVRVAGAKPSRPQAAAIRRSVRRILRLEEDLSSFHAICKRHPSLDGAAQKRFGRLIRSATLFEDIVKVICTCNITWKQTVAIVESIVQHYGIPTRNDPAVRCFPGAERLAAARVSGLKNRCKLGYRAPFVLELAREIASGRLDLSTFENNGLSSDELFKELRTIKGVGDYAAGNLLMLLGHYDRLAVDTETVRHFKALFPRRNPTPTNIHRHYKAFQPYAFLAYWYELWTDYDGSIG